MEYYLQNLLCLTLNNSDGKFIKLLVPTKRLPHILILAAQCYPVSEKVGEILVYNINDLLKSN